MRMEPRVSAVRRIVAPVFTMTEDNLRVRTDQLYRQPELSTVLPGRRAGGGDREGLRATAAATSLVILTAMLGKSRERIGPAVVRLWLAKCAEAGKRCVVTGATSLGQALTALVEHPEMRAELDRIDLMFEFEVVSLHWRDGSAPSRFHPHAAKEWNKVQRRARALDDSAILIRRLPGPTLQRIAALIDQEATA